VPDFAQLYAFERAALIDRVRRLNPADATTPVPACPGWTVKDVVAHLSGLVAETLADVPPPRGSDEATARQVGDRADWTLARVCDEWERNAAAFDEWAAGDPDYAAALAGDLVVHGHDIAEALELPIAETSPGTLAATERYVALLQDRAAEQLDVALTVELLDVDFDARPPPAGSRPLHLAAPPYELLRSVTGRRTRARVEAFEWTGDPSTLLSSCFTQYGALDD